MSGNGSSVQRSQLRVAFSLGLALYVGLALAYVWRTSFVVDGVRVFTLWDDGMVSMRYARNLALGAGLVWNPGERVQGYSNLGVTLIMAAIHCLPLDRTKTALVFQLFNVGLLVCIVYLVRSIAARLCASRTAGDACALAMMACIPVAILALQGTDVGVMSCLLLAALDMVVRASDEGRNWPFAVYGVLALGLVMRLDFALVAAIFALASLGFDGGRECLRAGAFLLIGVLAAIVGFQLAYYGDPLPNTYHLKVAGTPVWPMIKAGLAQEIPLLRRAALALCATCAAIFAWQRQDRRVWLLAALVVGLFAYHVRVGGDWLQGNYTSRMVAPALPLVIVAFVVAASLAAERLTRVSHASERDVQPDDRDDARSRKPDLLFSCLALLASLQLANDYEVSEFLNRRTAPMFREYNELNVRLGRYLRRHMDPQATFAVHWAGAPPYFADLRAIDVLGKCEPRIAKQVVSSFVFAGHSKWNWDYILHTRRPDVLDKPTRGLGERADFRNDYVHVQASGLSFFMRAAAVAKLHDPLARIEPVSAYEAARDMQ